MRFLQRRLVAVCIAFAVLALTFIPTQVSAVLTAEDTRQIALSKEAQERAFNAGGKTWQYLGEFDPRIWSYFPTRAEEAAREAGAHPLGVVHDDNDHHIRYLHSWITADSRLGQAMRMPEGRTLMVVWKYSEATRNMDLVNTHMIKDDEAFDWGAHKWPLKDVLRVTTDLHGRPL